MIVVVAVVVIVVVAVAAAVVFIIVAAAIVVGHTVPGVAGSTLLSGMGPLPERISYCCHCCCCCCCCCFSVVLVVPVSVLCLSAVCHVSLSEFLVCVDQTAGHLVATHLFRQRFTLVVLQLL